MIKYYQIPEEILMQQEVRSAKKKCPNWTDRKMLSTYMDAYTRGVKGYKESSSNDQKLELTYIAIYYILRQEFLRRLTPFVILRGKDYLAVCNNALLRLFDQYLAEGVDTCPEEATRCIAEIRNRLNN